MRSPKIPASKRRPAPAERRTKWLARAVLLALALAVYSNTFGLGLVGDSKAIVRDDTRIREASAENVKLIFQKDYWWPAPGDRLYRPVTTASLLLNYAAFGDGEDAAGYHALNAALHAVNALLAYELALLLLGAGGPAFFAAALWAAHPIATEAVAHVVGRADLLAAMAVLGGLLLYARSGALTGWRRGAAAAALFAIATAGAFSKENAAVLAGLMLLWDIAPVGRASRPAFPNIFYGAVAASLALLFAARYLVFRALPWPQRLYIDNPLSWEGFWSARLTAIKVIGKYLWLLAWPFRLSSDYSYPQVPVASATDLWAWLSLLVVIAILAAAVARRRKDPLLFFLTGFFGIALLPVSNLVVFIGSMMAERFLYLPSLAFAFAVSALAYRTAPRRSAAIGLAVLAALYGVRAAARNLDWNNDLTLASADVQTAPRSFRLHATLAKALWEQNEAQNIDEAIRQQETAWALIEPLPVERSSELPPTFLGVYYTFKADQLGGPAIAQSRAWYEKSAAVSLRARRISEAAGKAFDEAQLAHGKPLTLRVGLPFLYINLGNAYLNLGRYEDALEALRSGRGINPGFPLIYDALENVYWLMGQRAEAAIVAAEKAIVSDFAPADVAKMREIYARIPDAGCAMGQPGAAWRLDPGCARIQADLCRASAELADAFVEARKPARGQEIRQAAVKNYGCRDGL